MEYSGGFEKANARRVRLLLDRDGRMNIEDQVVMPSVGCEARAFLSRQRTDSRDAMLFHKTTHRPLYARAFKEAVDAGFDDLLFMNERDEVTEGAISNVFVVKDGKWLTPPAECGLLAGVYRRHLLETRPGVEERVLVAEDLRRADLVYLCNAVRGMRQVTIDWESGSRF